MKSFKQVYSLLVESESIISTAVKTPDGTIFTGSWHAAAAEKAVRAGKLKRIDDERRIDGFVSNKGRFLTRNEVSDLISDYASYEILRRGPIEIKESIDDRIFYHVTANKAALLAGDRSVPPNFDKCMYDYPGAFYMYDNLEDAEWHLGAMKRNGKPASEIVIVKIPEDVEVWEDKAALGRAYVTLNFNKDWVIG